MTTEAAPPDRRRLRVSVRLLMALVLLAAVVMGHYVNKVRRQREAVAAVEESGGWINYDWEFIDGTLTSGTQPPAPSWLRELLGDEYFQEIAHVSLLYDESLADGGLAPLAKVPGLERLSLRGYRFTDKGLALLKRWTGLKRLRVGLGAGWVTDDGLVHLKGMTNLELLDLPGGGVTDKGLEHLKGLSRLRELWLGRCGVTSEGKAAFIRAMPNLQVFQ